MSAEQAYGKIATTGLVFGYDTKDTRNSYLGPPTTNLFTENDFGIYDNVPGNVSATLTATTETYQGATVWKEVLTPLDATGVSYLSNANNPGIGVYQISSPTFYSADGYTGCSIFFKSNVPLVPTLPIYNQYSNIAGWVGSTYYTYDDMGDGWYRAWVLWTSGSNGTDAKYWAINPLTATVNVPIEVYWAGPFKEAQNRQFVSRYTKTSRSVTQGLIPLVGTQSLDLTNMSYNSCGNLTFNGTSNYILCGVGTDYPYPYHTFEAWIKTPGLGDGMTMGGIIGLDYGRNVYIGGSGNIGYEIFTDAGAIISAGTSGVNAFDNRYHHVVCSRSSTAYKIYFDGALKSSGDPGDLGWNGLNIYSGMAARIGNNPNDVYFRFNGEIPIVRIYNRALTDAEVRHNFDVQRTRFGV